MFKLKLCFNRFLFGSYMLVKYPIWCLFSQFANEVNINIMRYWQDSAVLIRNLSAHHPRLYLLWEIFCAEIQQHHRWNTLHSTWTNVKHSIFDLPVILSWWEKRTRIRSFIYTCSTRFIADAQYWWWIKCLSSTIPCENEWDLPFSTF